MADRLDSPARRRLLSLLALAPLGAALPAWAGRAAAEAGLIAPSACLLTPELTEGPFWLDDRLMRADITEGRPGAPVELAIQVVDAACRPIPGARVDVWHCDARGDYSGFPGQPGGDTTGETFLRGVQVAGADGVATFRTIWPGWYPGRTPHFHYKAILPEQGGVLTSQIFLPDGVSERIYGQGGAYARRGRRVVNARDRIALAAGEAAVATVTPRAGGIRRVALVAAAADPGAPPQRRRG